MDCGKPLTAAGAVAKRTSAAEGGGGGSAAGPPRQASNIPATQVAGPAPSSRADTGPCPFCGGPTSELLPFCPNCGRRLTAPGSGPACARCGSAVQSGTKFCATCGAPLGDWSPLVRTSGKPAPRTDFRITLTVLDEAGTAGQRLQRKTKGTTIGGPGGGHPVSRDPILSPPPPQNSLGKE